MVDTIKTRTQLIHRALASIGALEPGEAPSTEDYDTMDNLVDPLVAQLAADGVVYIDNTEEIPVQYFILLANLLANMAGPDFGSPVNEDARIRDETILKRITSTQPRYTVTEGEYF